MILDNENNNPKVHEWISDYTKEGALSIVTGYFTIGALVYLSKATNERINEYKFIIGDIVSSPDAQIKALDLLNENLNIENASKLKSLAEEAVEFLKLDKIEIKTLEPNFCHAKLVINKIGEKFHRDEYFVMGSSNLTEAGLGLKTTSNIELNIAGQSSDPRHRELYEWFKSLWNKPQAHLDKTIIDSNGVKRRVNFKQYLIDEISKLFKIYTPLEIYEKIIFELFHTNSQDESFTRNLGKLENTIVYNKLFPFQKSGVINLIKMLTNYNGAILADAVGLGKTWTTLALIKYFEFKGYDTIVICPKRLEHNWKQYIKRNNSIFEPDQLDYLLKFHTDFTDANIENDNLHLSHFLGDKPKLIVIDESHNLRNDKSIKYRILVEKILKKTRADVKVLLLSATPINNSFTDVRNQFLLMCKGMNNGFDELLGVRNMIHTFSSIQKEYNKWNVTPGLTLADFYKQINDSDFFKLTENLVVARTRKAIRTHFDKDFKFPKHKEVININKTPIEFQDVEDFTQLMDNLRLNLSAYQPTQFTLTKKEVEKLQKDASRDVINDNTQREYFLVKMMKILLLKRLESSWFAFKNTVDKIYLHHENLLTKINDYQKIKSTFIESNIDEFYDELMEENEDYLVGKGNPVPIADIDRIGRLDEYKRFLKKDKDSLRYIKSNLEDFSKEFEKDYRKDIKLVELIKIINAKKKQANPKIVIFTTYADTANYLYEILKKLEYNKIAMVAGSAGKMYFESKEEVSTKKIEDILQHFAPFTKLFKEKKWSDFSLETEQINYQKWLEFIKEFHPRTLDIVNNQIDILISTDVLSEGQNLQDADMVINYDVHWNPVRIVQRFGRIDRIGSPNDFIQLVNFWPARDIDAYIKLKKRVEDRMSVMQFMGSEILSNMTPELIERNESNLEEKQTEVLLRQMQNSIEDLDSEKSLGFDDFSFDNYRQELTDILQDKKQLLQGLPHGIFSGIKIAPTTEFKSGIIALLGMKPKLDHKYRTYELVYISDDKSQMSNNQKSILEFLAVNKMQSRIVDSKIDSGDSQTIENIKSLLTQWIDSQNKSIVIQTDGSEVEMAGQGSIDLLKKIKQGDKKTISNIHSGGPLNADYTTDNLDLLTWLIISN